MKLLPERDLTVNTVHGRLTFSSKDKFIGWSLYTAGHYGYAQLLNAVDILKENNKLAETNQGYVIDIGANIGTICIPLVRDRIFEKALAFEPEVRNFTYLRHNLEQNGLSDRISAYQLALSSTNAEAELEMAIGNYGDHRVRLNGHPSSNYNHFDEQDREVVRVPIQSLDYTLQSLGIEPQEIKLVWMDIQGHEGHVLLGAERVIAAGVPFVFELWPYGLRSSGTDLESFLEFVIKHFNRFWDLRADSPEELPIVSIRETVEALKNGDAAAQTDVLVF
jgi:FkbM family methyltransferase